MISNIIKPKHFITLIILFLLIYQFVLKEYFIEGVLDKFLEFSNSSNLLTGRTDIWRNILKDSTFFGYGFEYFSNYLQIQAHNDVLQFIGMYGIFSGGLLALFLGFTIIISVQYVIKKRQSAKAVIPIVFVISFILLGMAETVLGFNAKTPTMVYYNIVGVLLLYS